MTETWKPAVGFEGRYEVSDLGAVRSLPRPRTKGGPLKPTPQVGGYLRLELVGKDGKRLSRSVHRLVLEAFVGPRPEGMQAAHRNGIVTDNRVSNLYWATVQQNAADRIAHGKHAAVMREKRKLTEADAAFIRANHKVIKQTDLAAMFSVHRATVQRIHSGERYLETDAVLIKARASTGGDA